MTNITNAQRRVLKTLASLGGEATNSELGEAYGANPRAGVRALNNNGFVERDEAAPRTLDGRERLWVITAAGRRLVAEEAAAWAEAADAIDRPVDDVVLDADLFEEMIEIQLRPTQQTDEANPPQRDGGAPCPAEGAVLHGVEVAVGVDGEMVFATGRCEHCGEKLHEEGEKVHG